MELKYLPVGFSLKGKKAVVIGGGKAAALKVRKLLAAGAHVLVISPEVAEEIRELQPSGRLAIRMEPFVPEGEIEGDIVVAATSSRKTNRIISKRCRGKKIPVNVVDDPGISDFTFLAVTPCDDFLVAVSTDGKNPGVARRVREFLDESRFEIGRRVAFGKRAPREGKRFGRVFLTGAGPGSPDLLTVRALAAIKSADVIIKDYLVPDEVIESSASRARVIRLGKKGISGHHIRTDRQDYVNRLMVMLAKKGKVVVRLKSGDPFVFGRGGEELEYILAKGVGAEIIPGITAAIGGAASANIPLTHRDYSSSLLFITGRKREGKQGNPLDLNYLPGASTVVSYMSVSRAPELKEKFLRDGFPGDTPVAIVEKATRCDERVIYTTVELLDETVEREKVASPALVYTGEAVSVSMRCASLQREVRSSGGAVEHKEEERNEKRVEGI